MDEGPTKVEETSGANDSPDFKDFRVYHAPNVTKVEESPIKDANHTACNGETATADEPIGWATFGCCRSDGSY